MIIFVGDKPSPRMKPGAKPFEGAACENRLKEWIKHLDTRHYDIVNQCDFGWANFLTMDLRGAKLIALGNNASKALKGIPHFKLPHPSGLNRQVNDKDFISRKLTECKEWIKSIK